MRTLRSIPDPYTRLIADIGDLRSIGLRNLGDASHPVPLLPEIRHYLVAGTLAADPWLALWFGDALVPLSSATAGACRDAKTTSLPPEHVKIFASFAHMRLAHDPAVYAQLRSWCEVVS
jgi:triacylglycerol lipase